MIFFFSGSLIEKESILGMHWTCYHVSLGYIEHISYSELGGVESPPALLRVFLLMNLGLWSLHSPLHWEFAWLIILILAFRCIHTNSPIEFWKPALTRQHLEFLWSLAFQLCFQNCKSHMYFCEKYKLKEVLSLEIIFVLGPYLFFFALA